MRKRVARLVSVSVVMFSAALVGYRLWSSGCEKVENGNESRWPDTGVEVGDFKGVVIYSNGSEVYKSHGKHFADDGYYFGHQWQCVEFVKRYYFQVHSHRMPNVWGHAKDYFRDQLEHGAWNEERGMHQYQNGGDEAPQVGDLLVWNKGPYGHVAVISEVGNGFVTIAQQNIQGRPFDRLPLVRSKEGYTVGGSGSPAGWLRLP